MNMNSSFYLDQSSDSSFELPQYPILTSTPCALPTKPQSRGKISQKQKQKERWCIRAPDYPDDVPGAINLLFVMHIGDSPSLCTYSKKLKRVYVVSNQLLRIKFTWIPSFQPLFLRSAMVFAEEFHKLTPVQRCYAHMSPELPQNHGLGCDQLRYVFRVSDPVNKYSSIYEPDVNKILTTRSMLKPESGEAWLEYQFFCQNSCPTGINRRPTKMIFLIENSMGAVVAKRSIMIQICANPKRDVEREEWRASSDLKKPKVKKQLSQQQSPLPPVPPINFPDTSNPDETVYSLNIDIVGNENYKSVLKYAYDVMAAQAIRTGNHQLLKPHMDAVLIKEQRG